MFMICVLLLTPNAAGFPKVSPPVVQSASSESKSLSLSLEELDDVSEGDLRGCGQWEGFEY